MRVGIHVLLFRASVHSFMYDIIVFYSIITFSYATYFVHAYTIGVVFTLSYCVSDVTRVAIH